MIRKFLALALVLFAHSAHAAVIEFVPPNDPTGSVFTTNSNDGWNSGRGVVFQATGTEIITSVGLFHDLTGMTLSYKVSEVLTVNGDVETGETILASGSATVTTSGLEWIDFPIPNIPFTAGSIYHIEFSFPGTGNQNFFYNNGNVTFTQDGFEVIDGTSAGNTGNSVMPAIRLETQDVNAAPPGPPPTPVPTLSQWSILLMALLLGFLGVSSLNRRKHSN